MKDAPDIARIAALIGDPARANMLSALMSGKALTATELSQEAGVANQTASFHLRQLSDGGLVRHRKQGRHRYFDLASDDVAQVLEKLMGLAIGTGHTRSRTGPRNAELRKARVCYNHLAGHMGIKMYDSFLARDFLRQNGTELVLTNSGGDFIRSFGIDLGSLQRKKAPLCRECLDWSERRSHLAGSVGRALLARMEELGWIRRDANSRIIRFSRNGEKKFLATFSD